MSPHRRIPNVISIFNHYLLNTDDFLQEVIEPDPPVFHNWKRLGLNQESADEWHGRRLHWQNELYPNYTDPNSKTRIVNAQVKAFMKDFIAFGSPLLNIMASGYAVTESDAVLFRFKIGRRRSARSPKTIADPCFPTCKPRGKHDKIKMRFRSQRASRFGGGSRQCDAGFQSRWARA